MRAFPRALFHGVASLALVLATMAPCHAVEKPFPGFVERPLPEPPDTSWLGDPDPLGPEWDGYPRVGMPGYARPMPPTPPVAGLPSLDGLPATWHMKLDFRGPPPAPLPELPEPPKPLKPYVPGPNHPLFIREPKDPLIIRAFRQALGPEHRFKVTRAETLITGTDSIRVTFATIARGMAATKILLAPGSGFAGARLNGIGPGTGIVARGVNNGFSFSFDRVKGWPSELGQVAALERLIPLLPPVKGLTSIFPWVTWPTPGNRTVTVLMSANGEKPALNAFVESLKSIGTLVAGSARDGSREGLSYAEIVVGVKIPVP